MVKEELLNGSHAEISISIPTRTTNVLWKRKDQLNRWEESETNKICPEKRPDHVRQVKFQDRDVFLSACLSGDEDEVNELLEKGADVNTATVDGLTALHQGVIDGKASIVQFLTERGADVSAQDNEGWTPLHAAACCGNTEIVRFLCDQGADLTITNSDKELAIDLAEDDACRQILEREYESLGIDVENCKNREEEMMMSDVNEWLRNNHVTERVHPRTGATALHVAAAKGYIKLINLLLQANVDVNARDNDGWTPLHGAAHWGEKQACEILAENGVDFTIKSYAGQTPFDIADEDILAFLHDLKRNSSTCKCLSPEESSSLSSAATDPDRIAPKRRISVTRMPTNEKIALAKRDEAEEHDQLVRTQRSSVEVVEELTPFVDKVTEKVTHVAAEPRRTSESAPIVFKLPSSDFHKIQTPPRPTWQMDGKRASTKTSVEPPVTNTSAVVVTPVVPMKRPTETVTDIPPIGSFTPPQQPAMREESESERMAKSRQQRQARRSTQGITREQLQDARQIAAERKLELEQIVQQSSTTDRSSSEVESDSPKTPTSPSMTWRSRTLETTPADSQHSLDNPESPPTFDRDFIPPFVTPSASNLRRKPIFSRVKREMHENDNQFGVSIQISETPTTSSASRTTTTNSTILRNSNMNTIDKSLSGYANRYPGYAASSISSQPSERSSLATSRANSNNSIRSSETSDIDYKMLYERERAENDRLRMKINELESQLHKQKLSESQSENGLNRRSKMVEENGDKLSKSMSDQGRKGLERKISQLEQEVQTIDQLRSDNQRLKDENGALIRVISKLSK